VPRRASITPFFDDPRLEMITMPEQVDEAYVNAHTSLDLTTEARSGGRAPRSCWSSCSLRWITTSSF
jgi:hypothetical protein